MVTTEPDIFAARSTERVDRVIELARLCRQVREAQLDFLRRYAAEEASEQIASRRAGFELSDVTTPDDLNRPVKPHRLTFDP
jgi:hypothetical protein